MDSSDELKIDANCGDLSSETEADLLEDVYHYITKKQYMFIEYGKTII